MFKNSKTITLNQRLSCTAFELSVGQILSVLWLMDEYEYPTQIEEFAVVNADNLLLKSHDVLVFDNKTDFAKLKQDESEKVIALFFEVNKAFFKGNDRGEYFGEPLFTETITGREFYDQLSSNSEVLARHGHSNVLSYPFSYFLTVIENFNEANRG